MSKMNAVTSLRFLFSVSQIFGLVPFSLKKSGGSPEFVESPIRLAYTLAMCSFFMTVQGSYIYIHSGFEGSSFTSEISSKFVLIVSAIANYSSFPVLLVRILSRKKLFCRWLNRVNRLFSNLTVNTLSNLAKVNFWLVTTTAGFLALVGLSDFSVRKDGKTFEATGGSVVGMGLWLLCFYTITWEVKIFIHYFLFFVNGLRELYKEIHKTFRNAGKRLNKKFWVYYMNSLRAKDLMAKDLLSFLHVFFVPVVSLQLLWEFCSMLFITTMATRIGVPPFIQVLWGAFVFSDIFLVIGLCHFTEREAEKMAEFVHVCFIQCDDVDLKEEIEVFSLQCQHVKVEFHALGLFKLNFSLLYTIIASLTSYAVILIQFQNEQELQDGKICLKRVMTNCSSLPK